MLLSRLVPLLAVVAALAAAPAAAAAQPGGDDMATLTAYRLTEAKLDQFERASRAMIAAVQDPAVRRQVEAIGDEDHDDPTIADIAARIDRVPAMKRAITGAGMTTRDYVTFQLSLFQASMAVALLDTPGAGSQLPEGTPPQNVAFARTHRQRIEAMTRELRQLQGDDDDDDDDADDDPPARR